MANSWKFVFTTKKSKFREPSFVQDLWQICFQIICICFQIIIFAVEFQLLSAMTKYPIGLQNFQGLREDGYFYVDK